MNNKILNTLYTIHSPSKKEDQMLSYLKRLLNEWRIDFKVGPKGQLYSINPGTPLLVAHTDQVQKSKCDVVKQYKNRIYGFDSKGNLTGLGADDKNGIYITLMQIQNFRENVSFIFSTNEEAGGYLYLLTQELETDLMELPYALIFDRKGSSDIIGTSNNYCCDDLETAIKVVGSEYGYKPTTGVFSDCDELCSYLPCVNLSCGYYQAHTTEEYTKPAELWKANKLADCLIKGLPRKGRPFETPESFSPIFDEPTNWRTGRYGYYSTPTTTTVKKTNKVINTHITKEYMDDAWLEIDDRFGCTFYDEDGGEAFIGDDFNDICGEWPLESGTLLIDRKLRDNEWEYSAVYTVQGLSFDIDVVDYREDYEMEDA